MPEMRRPGMVLLFFLKLCCLGTLRGAFAKTILETAADAGSFTTLAAALAKAQLIQPLNSPGPFTVFAPTDAAFAALLANLDVTADALLERADLADILKFHVASGRTFSATLGAGAVVQTLEGARLKVNVVGGVVKIGDASVVTADLKCSNGVIHIIDSVLLPPERLRLAGGISWDKSLWRTQVDGVMGGKSTGAISFEDEAMVFSGVINLDGGGFSQAQKAFASVDFRPYAGLLVETDAQPFTSGAAPLGLHLEVQTSGRRGGRAAALAVPLSQVPGERTQLFVPMSTLDRATWGGSSWDPARVTGLQFSVLYQGGPFIMKLRKISAVRQALDAPVVTSPVIALESGGDIIDLIQATINSGAVLYDKGYHELCIAQYTSVTRTILVASGVSAATRGIACASLMRAAEGASTSKAERAWVLRRAFDALLMDLQSKGRVPDVHYPANVRGDWLPMPGAAGLQPRVCAALQDDDATGYAGRPAGNSAGSNGMSNVRTEPSDSTGFDGFVGPIVGMGISGHNDFGAAHVSNPEECAQRCRSQPQCMSFDYGARGSVSGECWLSRANRASAGDAYSSWPHYDYFETGGGANAIGANNVNAMEANSMAAGGLGSTSAESSESLTSNPLFWALLGAGVAIIILVLSLVAIMRRQRLGKPTDPKHTTVSPFVVQGNPGGNSADVVVGKPVVVVAVAGAPVEHIQCAEWA